MGRIRSWSDRQLYDAVAESKSVRGVLVRLGLIPAGGNYVQVQQRIQNLKINTTHFAGKGWNKGMRGLGKPRIPLKTILVQNSTYQSFKLKKRLFGAGLKNPLCEECGWAKVSPDGYLPLELDHINGDRNDNRIENLRILCPNCHSLQPTHRGRNQKRARVA